MEDNETLEQLEDEKTIKDLKVDFEYTNWYKDELKSGDIICGAYGDFQGKKRVGIFLVIYSEKRDRTYTGYNTNYQVAKITTNNLLGDSYTVRLHEGEANLLNDCIVTIGKNHTFANKQIYKKIGTLSPKVMTFVYKEYFRYQTEISRQILQEVI